MEPRTETVPNTPWELFRRTAIATPESEAIIDARREERFTYQELFEHVTGFAGSLATRGIGKGDTYATVLKNGLEQTSAVLASTALGAVANTVNYRQSPDAIAHILDDSDTRVVIFDEANRDRIEAIRNDLETVDSYLYAGDNPPGWTDEYDEAVREGRGNAPPAPELDPTDPAYLVYTSGTTGPPKGCLYVNDRLVETLLWVKATFDQSDERGLLVAPQAHAAGSIGGGTNPLFTGGTIVTLPEFDPVAVMEWIERESITYLLAVPAMLRAMMQVDPSQFETESLEKVVSFGSPLPENLAESVAESFDLKYFGNHMGSTECAWYLTRDVRDDLSTATSPGTAALNVETRVVTLDENDVAGDPDSVCDTGETGELIVKTPYGMDRYLGKPDVTSEAFRDGWYYTGDVGFVDEDGRFQPEGRKTNMIISGGINVSDVNVERILEEHPDVIEVAVVGVPDEKWGEKVLAYVVADPNSDITADGLLKWCRERSDLAEFQRPKSVEILDELPRSATGKVQKFKLEAPLQA
ncbi:MAG: class I adenylate-forming enzyme family protein [Natronomonas sp.]